MNTPRQRGVQGMTVAADGTEYNATMMSGTAAGGGNTNRNGTTKRLTFKELSAKISYPTYKKPQEKLVPLRTDIGRRALEIFHQQKKAFGISSRLKMAVGPANRAARGVNNNNADGTTSAIGANTSSTSGQRIPFADLPNATASQLDDELTRYLELIATGGLGCGPNYNEADTYLGAAIILQLKNRFLDALEYYSKCVTADPLLTECYLHRAQCFAKVDRPSEALDEYKKYLQMEPATKALLADGGKCALDADRLDEAEQLFLACLSVGADPAMNPLATTTLTTPEGTIVAAGAASVAALLLRNRQQQAIQTGKATTSISKEGMLTISLVKGAATSSSSPDSHTSAADDQQQQQRDPDEWNIADDMPMASEEQTHDSYSFYNLGEVEERRGNATRASGYYAKVNPTFATPYFDQGRQEFANENYAMALRLFEAVAKILPEEVSVHLWLADTYTALGINEFSLCVLSCLTRAISLPEKASTFPPEMAAELIAADPDSKHLETTLLRRGMLHVNVLGDMDSALADFGLCLAHNPENADALLSRARTLLLRNEIGDEELAVADYEVVVTLASVPATEKAHPYEILGLFYEKKKRYAEAGRYLALAVCAGAMPPQRSVYRCLVHNVASTTPTATTGSEELPFKLYDARGWVPKVDPNEATDKAAGKKSAAAIPAGSAGVGPNGQPLPPAVGPLGATATDAFGAPRSAPVMPLSYALVDSYYQELRNREPTVHRTDECSVIEQWRPVREAMDARKEEAEAAKANKKKGKR